MRTVNWFPVGGAAVSGQLRRWERFTWKHPEWWCLALSAAAWLMFIAPAASGVRGQLSSNHLDHEQVIGLPGGATGTAWLRHLLIWLLMIVAMMVPTALLSIRTTATRSLWRRRHRAIGGFLLGYLGIWFLAGSIALAMLNTLDLHDRSSLAALAAAGFAVAAAWQVFPAKRRALWSCHRTAPLAPRGWKADRDCIRYGCTIGGRCLVSCWALMLPSLLTGHGLLAMGIAAAIGTSERHFKRPEPRVHAVFLAGFALVFASFTLG